MLTSAVGVWARPSSRYALLDFPEYSNVGDSAIWLGEMSLLSKLTGRMPAYVCSVDSFDATALAEALPEGPIFLSGGGNFGDLWPRHQMLREAVLARIPGRPVVQLPQSIDFTDDASVARCARAIENHGAFQLFVRDHRSFELATSRFACRTELIPDAAFALGPLRKPTAPVDDLFILLRTDSERRDHSEAAFDPRGAAVGDWIHEPADYALQCRRRARLLALASLHLGAAARRRVLYQQLAQGRLERGLRTLASGRKVVTDRLHAHILCTLMGIPHVALDNSYGKIHGYIDAWTKDCAGVTKASSLAEAMDKVQAL